MPLEVRMLGEFSLRSGPSRISDSGSRSKKVWLFLACLICNCPRPVSVQEAAQLLWGEEQSGANPPNALKTILHRTRAVLDALGDGAGRCLLLHREGAFLWNPEVPFRFDLDDFERLCQEGSAARNREGQISLWTQALSLYCGPFLPRLSSEHWVIPRAARCHRLYTDTLRNLLPLLEETQRWEAAEQLCQTALEHDPLSEEFCLFQMRALLRLQRSQEAADIYERMSQRLLSSTGVPPSDGLRTLYQEALQQVNGHAAPAGVILDQLREPPDSGGALLCQYDVFQTVCRALARSISRSGGPAHLALLSILPQPGRELPQHSLERAAGHLGELLRTSLRRGDAAARCSASQFILLLPQADFENSRMVCDRLIRAFQRGYPHSPARLDAYIYPLEPNGSPPQSGRADPATL